MAVKLELLKERSGLINHNNYLHATAESPQWFILIAGCKFSNKWQGSWVGKEHPLEKNKRDHVMPKNICTAVSVTIPWNLNQVSSHLYPVSETWVLSPRGLSSHSKVTYTGTTLLQRSQEQNSRHRNRGELPPAECTPSLASAHSPAELRDCKCQIPGWAVRTASLGRPYTRNSHLWDLLLPSLQDQDSAMCHLSSCAWAYGLNSRGWKDLIQCTLWLMRRVWSDTERPFHRLMNRAPTPNSQYFTLPTALFSISVVSS